MDHCFFLNGSLKQQKSFLEQKKTYPITPSHIYPLNVSYLIKHRGTQLHQGLSSKNLSHSICSTLISFPRSESSRYLILHINNKYMHICRLKKTLIELAQHIAPLWFQSRYCSLTVISRGKPSLFLYCLRMRYLDKRPLDFSGMNIRRPI